MRIVSVEPCFRVLDVQRAIEHYRCLGFTTSVHDETYAFAHRDDLTIHLMLDDGDPCAHATLYLHVSDADELAAEWTAAGVTVEAPVDYDYGLHEGRHTDPDGNVIRFGSPRRNGAAP
jgi:catechol 2,3-dioxygenase-like lactoylglutathione lyase family enzyme